MYRDHNVFITHKLGVLRRMSLKAVFSDGINDNQKILEESVCDWTTRPDATWVLKRNR